MNININLKTIKQMKKFLLNLQFILRPNYYILAGEYSKEYDDFLNLLLDNNSFKYVSRFTVTLGGYLLWFGDSGAYSAFMLYDNCNRCEYRASRLTILRAMKKYNKEIKKVNISKEIDFEKYKQY